MAVLYGDEWRKPSSCITSRILGTPIVKTTGETAKVTLH
jgi:hypothetical protein